METVKNILPLKLTNDIKYNIKLIKRKLNIYNLNYNTNYKLEDFDINIIYNRWENNESIFYYYKEINGNFDYNILDFYKENFYKASQFIKYNLKDCKTYERKTEPDILFLFKGSKFALEMNLKNKWFFVSKPFIYSIFEPENYSWLENSNLCNKILEDYFNKENFTTDFNSKQEINLLENLFKNKEFEKI